MCRDLLMLTVIIPCICKDPVNYLKLVNALTTLPFVKKIILSSSSQISYLGNSDIVEVVKTENNYYNNDIVKKAIEKVETEYLAIIPDPFLLKPSTVEFAFNTLLKRPDGMVVIGLQDNLINIEANDDYRPYLVYDRKIGPKDCEYCSFYKTTNLFIFEDNPFAAELTNHYVTAFMQKNTLQRGEKVAFIVNERFKHNNDYALGFDFSYFHDRQIAKNLSLVRKKNLSLSQRLCSLTYFEGFHYFNFLGMSYKFSLRHKPVFTVDCHNYFNSKDLSRIVDKRACVFAAFTRHGFISENTLKYLRMIREHVDYLVFVADSKAKDETITAVEEIADALIIGRHNEYYFGSYKRGVELLDKMGIINDIDNLILCNDTVEFVGTHNDLRVFFDKARFTDAYGVTSSAFGYGNKIGQDKYEGVKLPHIHSYFVNLKKNVFASDEFKKELYAVTVLKNKTDIAVQHEMWLGKFLEKHVYTSDSYYPYDDTCFVNSFDIYINDGIDNPLFVKHVIKR